jgi:hypothetical protein
MLKTIGRVAHGEIYQTTLSHFSPPAGCCRFVVPCDAAQELVLAVQVVLHHVLLVVNLIVFDTCRNWMVFVFHANRKDSGIRVASIVAAKELVVESARRINTLSIVQREESTAVVNEIPDGLLLSLGHPFHRLFLVAAGPVHSIAKNYEQLRILEGIGTERIDIFDEGDWDILAKKSRRQSVAYIDRTMVAIAN